MKQRDLINALLAAGFKRDRKGDHLIYVKPGCRPISVPDHREVNEMLARKILKDAGIDWP